MTIAAATAFLVFGKSHATIPAMTRIVADAATTFFVVLIGLGKRHRRW